MPSRREPERTCLGCRGRAPRRALLRVVRRPDGQVVVDPTGRAAGRGAYVHATETCLSRAARGGSLGRALRAPLPAAQAARLMTELRELLGGNA